MTDRDAMLAAILHAPDDDAPRLIFADWLDEHGEDARASFIRVQCELAQATKACWCKGEGRTAKNEFCGGCWPLRRREWELLDTHGTKWDIEFVSSIGCWWNERYFIGVDGDNRCPALFIRVGVGGRIILSWQRSRGFIATVRAPLVTLFGCECESCSGVGDDGGRAENYTVCPACHGKGRTPGIIGDLFAREPITRVEFTDREPQDYHNNDTTFHEGRLYGWWEGGSVREPRACDLPPDLWLEVTRQPGCTVHGKWADFPSPAAALDALSTVAVRLGRKRVKTILEGASRE